MTRKELEILFARVCRLRDFQKHGFSTQDVIFLQSLVKNQIDNAPREPSYVLYLTKGTYRRAPRKFTQNEMGWEFMDSMGVWIEISSPICQDITDFQQCYNLLKEESENG